MGACASFPKILGGKAPAPEQAKEETTEAVVVADKGLEMEEVKAEEKPEEVKTDEEQKEKPLVESTDEVKKETDEVAAPSSSAVEEKKTEESKKE